MEQYLYTKNFTKHYIDNNNNNNNHNYYLEYKDINITIVYINKNSYSTYLKKIYNIDITVNPDEVFLVIKNNNLCCKIIEHKYLNRYLNKNPLKTGATNIQLYDMDFNNDDKKIRIELSYSINNYVNSKLNSDNPENINIKKILNRLNINTFNNENQNYNTNIYNWILS